MDNIFLEKEIKENYDKHEIFHHQRQGTLNDIEILLESRNELLFEIDINNLMPYYNLRSVVVNEEYGKPNFWNHIISMLFVEQLNNKRHVETTHNLDEEKKILTRGTIDDYKQVEEALINRNDFIEMLKYFNINRLHIMIKYVKSDDILNELYNYLEDDLPFITMIYSDRVITIDDEFDKNVKIFNEYEEGIEIKRKNNSKVYEKKI